MTVLHLGAHTTVAVIEGLFPTAEGFSSYRLAETVTHYGC